MNDSQHIEKVAVPVAFRLATQTADSEGEVFLEHGQRLVDMLNDGRPFFVLRYEGRVGCIAKRHVVSIEQLKKFTERRKPDASGEDD